MTDAASDTSAVFETLARALPAAGVQAGASADGMPTIDVPGDAIADVARVLRDDPSLQFAFLAEVTAADYLPRHPRYEVIYHLACLGGHYVVPGAASPAPTRRLRLRVGVPADDPRVPTVTGVWPAANWLEREVYDMFGIAFMGHPNLQRVLMPEDWVGHPLRKDYPVQIKKDAASWSPLQLTPEEFAANVRARQAVSDKLAAPRVPGAAGE